MSDPQTLESFFHGKVVVLTGAASGIGRALALKLARAGASVHALDSNRDGLETLIDKNISGGSIIPHLLDVRDFRAYQDVVGRITASSPRVDFLFNNAGVTLLGETQRIPFERHKWLLDINLMGVVHGIHLIYPLMIRQGGGWIINTASVAGATGYATATAYTASKAAVLELSRSLAVEAAHWGVKVSVACPGYVDSGIFAQDRITGADRDEVIKDMPVRMMTPDEAAGHLVSGIMKGGRIIVFPLSARLLWVVARWMPSVMTPLHKKVMKVFRKD